LPSLASEASFVKREARDVRERRDERERCDLKFEVQGSKFRNPRTSDLESSLVSPVSLVPPVSRVSHSARLSAA
jgi:hypothetical protein